MTNITPLPIRKKARMSGKLRKAIDLRFRKGLHITQACTEAGLSESGWHKAMKRPAVQDHIEELVARLCIDAETLRARGKVMALEVALDLMQNAKSEAVRARMAEFLASDAKVPQVAVHVDARQTGGYEYVRPNDRIVEIKPAQD